MPLQNRVNPFGGFDAVSARGAWLGNRGVIHDARKQVVAQWRSKAWIACQLHYRSVQRAVFSPHTWSELFFLDEATAFAAGHRPCAYCRRQRYNEFKHAWCEANAGLLTESDPRVTMIDARLHVERVDRQGRKMTYSARFGELSPGTLVVLDAAAWLVWRGRLFPWSHYGYGPPRPALPASAKVEVLTPKSIVAMFEQGFVPQVHESACGQRQTNPPI